MGGWKGPRQQPTSRTRRGYRRGVDAHPDVERQHYNVTLGVLVTAGIAFALQQTLVIPALPALREDLDTTTGWATWLLTAFLLSASVLTPLLGKLGDQYGKERLLVISLSIFLLGSIGGIFAWNIGSLIACRVIQGAGGAVFPLSFAIINDEFPRERRGTAIGIVSSVFAIGGSIGLVVALAGRGEGHDAEERRENLEHHGLVGHLDRNLARLTCPARRYENGQHRRPECSDRAQPERRHERGLGRDGRPGNRLRRQDRRTHLAADHAADRAHDGVHAGRDAGLGRPHRRDDDRRHRGEGEHDPEPERDRHRAGRRAGVGQRHANLDAQCGRPLRHGTE